MICRVCTGPEVRCYFCHHVHCDDDQCPEMPVDCARDAHESEAGGR